MGARAQLHIGNRLVLALSSRRVSRPSIKDKGAWCESQLVVLCGKRSAAIFSDGISKSPRSGERQPYLYWRSRDAKYGRKHMEDEPSAECTPAWVAHGSKFALIVGDK
jgi:hypothetical protein